MNAIKSSSQKKYHLTKREMEMLNWLRQGKTAWEISEILSISERCVIFHINNLKKKLNVVNRVQAVAVAMSKGIISL